MEPVRNFLIGKVWAWGRGLGPGAVGRVCNGHHPAGDCGQRNSKSTSWQQEASCQVLAVAACEAHTPARGAELPA